MKLTLTWLVLGCCLAQAWGLKGHQMQVRAAHMRLPAAMPKFFLEAREQLVLLGSEPDRWRGKMYPAATEATGGNHVFAWEVAPKPLPPHRHAYLLALVKAGQLDEKDPSMRRLGFGPYALEESAEILTGAFARWRTLKEGSIERKQEEQSILFLAGVLAHWVTDLSQPMHCSVHVLGWSSRVPNPHGYSTDPGIHAAYEAAYVESAIAFEDVEAALKAEPELKVGGAWLGEASRYVAHCNSKVEQLYEWEKAGPFGVGENRAAQKQYTVARLMEGAAMLHEVWAECWKRSETADAAKY